MISMLKNIKKSFGQKTIPVRFYKYFLSYILPVFIILLLLRLVIYGNFISSLRSEVETSNIAVLTQVKNIMDIRMKEIDHAAIHMSNNNILSPYSALKDSLGSYDAINELAKYKSGNEFLRDIAVYYNLPDNDRILTTTVDISLDRYFNYSYRYTNWSKGGFMEMMRAAREPVMTPVEMVEVNRYDNRELATYIYPFPKNISRPLGFFIFLIEADVLKETVNDILKDYQGYFYILDGRGKTLFSYSDSSQRREAGYMLNAAGREPVTGVSSITIDSEMYSVVRLPSEYNDWTYITIMPAERFMSKVYTTSSMFNLVMVFILIMGIMAAYAFATGSYRPVKNLMDLIAGLKKGSGIAEGKSAFTDEFKVIGNVLNEVSNENKGLQVKLKSKARLMKNQLLRKLFDGKPGSLEEFSSMQDVASFELEFPAFIVLIVMIDNDSLGKNAKDQRTLDLIKFSITNVVEELASDIGRGYGMELEDQRSVAFLLNVKKNYARESCISELSFKTKSFFRQYFNLTLTIGIGSIYDDPARIHESFLEANRAIHYRLIKGNDSVIFYQDIRSNMVEDYKYPVEKEQALIMAIKKGNIKEVEGITNDLKEYLTGRSLTPEAVQYICIGFINAIIKCVDEIGMEMKDFFPGWKENLYGVPFETLDELGNHIIDICNRICAYIANQKESKNLRLRDNVIALINQNYGDSTLCADQIADRCGVSSAYLRRYFLDQTGYSLNDYIDMVRMDKVKTLLKTTKLPLRDIISQTGYLNESSFIRKFKSREGMTPAQYRCIAGGDALDEAAQ